MVYTFAGSILMLVAIIAMVTIVGRGTGEYSFAYDHLVRHSDLLAPVRAVALQRRSRSRSR